MQTLRRKILLNALKLLDLLIMGICLVFSIHVFSKNITIPQFSHIGQIEIKIIDILFCFIAIFLWQFVFSRFNLYHSRRLSEKSKEIKDVFTTTVIGASLIFLEGLLLKISTITLPQIVLFWCCCFLATILCRMVLRYFLRWLRIRGRNLRYVLVIGTNHRAVQFAEEIVSAPELGYRFIGFVDDGWIGIEGFRRTSYRLICDLDGFQPYIRESVVDEVIVALPIKSFYNQASRIVSICDEQGIIVRYLSSIFDVEFSSSQLDFFESYSLIQLSHETIYGFPSIAKRSIDFVLASVLLLISFPFLLAVAIAVKLSSPGPAFFVQERVGYGKRIFRLYKFRTMIKEAEKQQKDIEEFNEAGGPVFKIKYDPRVTSIGKYLRKFSIDELPQLINVVKGDMSIVGPRPLPVRDYKGFSQDWHRRRFSVRPGITCLWQINGRCETPFEEWMKLDMEYIDQWSLWLDLKILIKTIPAVLKGIGAV